MAVQGTRPRPRWGVTVLMLTGVIGAGAAEPAGRWLSVAQFGATGSKFETKAKTVAGSNVVEVADVGDFQVGQGVMVSRCNIHYTEAKLWGPKEKYAASRKLTGEVEYRGYDGSKGSWTVYVIDIAPSEQPAFRWTDDLGRTWSQPAPIDDAWHPLGGGLEVRFHEFDWKPGYVVTLGARDQLVSTIDRIEGKQLILKDPANRTADDAVVRHCDDRCLQTAVNEAIKQKTNLHVPPGNYRLSAPVEVTNAAGLVIEGASAPETVLDISEGVGSCLSLRGGSEVTLRNLSMLGHSGFADRDQMGHLRTQGAGGVWGFYFKLCNAVHISNTERVLVENCHARKMSAECFYSSGRSRVGAKEPAQYTKAITYLRCSVEDCARNAFNNNDMAENTSVLYCRIRDVGGCSWEGASRFVRFTGNYVRNGGTVAMGNIRSRAEHYEQLGSGQHIVSDNVFEEGVCYGGCQIRATDGATQVLITNNLFINFGTSAIEVAGRGDARSLPSAYTMVRGNSLDMTAAGQYALPRFGIQVSASQTIVADNQIYARGAPDANLTAIRLQEPAIDLNVHNNQIRNCGGGIVTTRARSPLAEVVDETTFIIRGGGVANERRQSHRYAGWQVAWFKGEELIGRSAIDSYDPETGRFKLRSARAMKPGDQLEVFPAGGANWLLHDNLLTGCLTPLVLDAYGSPTSVARDNLIERGGAASVKQAILLAGRFDLLGNRVSGFDEDGSTALALQPDRAGRELANRFAGNRFERCRTVVAGGEALWKAADAGDNLTID